MPPDSAFSVRKSCVNRKIKNLPITNSVDNKSPQLSRFPWKRPGGFSSAPLQFMKITDESPLLTRLQLQLKNSQLPGARKIFR